MKPIHKVMFAHALIMLAFAVLVAVTFLEGRYLVAYS